MPRFAIEVPHQLGAETATDRIKQLLEKVKERYGSQVSNMQESWTDGGLDFQFTTYTFPIKGKLRVEPARVTIDGDLPFAAIMFKGRIEQTLRDELTKRLQA